MANRNAKGRLSDLRLVLIGVIIGAVLFGRAAAAAVSAIYAEPATSRIFIDGAEASLEAYSIEDANYYKIRDIAKALDIGLWYDDDRDIVYLETDIGFDPRYTGVRKEHVTPIAPMQKPVPLKVDNKKLFDLKKSGTESFSATVTIVKTVRGAEAADMIKNAYVHNPGAGYGKEYILAWVRAKITDTKNYMLLSDIRLNMVCESGDGVNYTVSSPTNINPASEQPKNAGDTIEGWVAFAVDRNDAEPRVKLGRLADGSDDAWFALYD